MDGPEGIPAAAILLCSKCEFHSPEAKKFCPRCGFPFASVFKQPVSTLQSLEPAIKTCAILFGINLLFLALKVTPKSNHLPIEIAIEAVFAAVILHAVYPLRSRIFFLTSRFCNQAYPAWKMVSLSLLTAVGLCLYFVALDLLGLRTIDYLEADDIGTLKVAWVFISTCLLAPVLEEIFFRGYLFRKIRLVLKPKEAIILQGLVFGVIHLSPAAYISHSTMGILFGYLRYRTNSLLPGILCHALWNLSVVGIQYWELTAA